MPSREKSRPSSLKRTFASLAAALVLVLTILAASPDLHELLHGRGPGAAGIGHQDAVPSRGGHSADDEDGCVVTLFAQGLVPPLALLALAFTGLILRLIDFALRDRVVAAAPRYLRLPSQAPPVGLS
jgi:hypothetical protein